MKSKIIVSLLSICLILSVTAGCKAKDTKASSSPTIVRTSSPAAKTATAAPVATAIVPAGTAVPVGKKITDAEKGKPFKDALELFSDNFDNNDYKSESVVLANPDSIEFKDGKLSMSNNIRNWSGYSTIDLFEVDGTNYKQIEYSTTFNTLGDKLVDPKTVPSIWMGLFVGIRVTEGVIADQPGGFWVSFSDQKKVAVYPGYACFPAGAVTLDLPVDAITVRTVTVIDNGDKIYYYITDDSGANYLILRADITADKVIIYKNDGTVAKECVNQLNTTGVFSLFDHFTNTFVDKISIKGSN